MPISLIVLTAATPLSLVVTISSPQEPTPPVVDGNIRSYWFGAEQDGRPGGSTGEPEGPSENTAPSNGDEEQSIGPHECKTVKDNVQVCTPVRRKEGGPKVSPAQLAMEEWRRLPIPAPRVRTAPPRRAAGLVGLPEWFWVTNWRSLGGRASAGAAWVEVSAIPQRMTIEPGDGRHTVRCPGPGAPYVPTKSATSQHTNCSHTYVRSSAAQPGGAYRVRVAVDWGGTWRSSEGTGGVLPPLSRSTSFRLRIAEAQGLYG